MKEGEERAQNSCLVEHLQEMGCVVRERNDVDAHQPQCLSLLDRQRVTRRVVEENHYLQHTNGGTSLALLRQRYAKARCEPM